jgi:hypothetical protein
VVVNIVLLLGIVWNVRHCALQPAGLRLLGTALLFGLPIVAGIVLFTIAKRHESMTLDRDTWALVGVVGGWSVGAVLLHVLGRRPHLPG